jgi:hypothetical protein
MKTVAIQEHKDAAKPKANVIPAHPDNTNSVRKEHKHLHKIKYTHIALFWTVFAFQMQLMSCLVQRNHFK